LIVVKKSKKELVVKLGEAIRKERLKQKIPQIHMAMELKTSLRQYQRIENGEINSGIISYSKIAEILELKLSDLLKKVE